MKTFIPKIIDIKREKHVLDASKKPLGRVATEAAAFLIGKNKVDYSPNMDLGDHVTVENASKLILTGNKMEKKEYHSHSWYIGNQRTYSAREKFEKNPIFLVKNAIKGMLPKNRLQKSRLKRLTILLQNNGK